MKVLVICNKSPWPKSEGGPIAMHAMINGLIQAGHTVKVLAASTNKFPVDPKTIPTEFQEKTQIEFVDIDLSLSIPGALLSLLLLRSYHVARFHTKAFADKLKEILQNDKYDLIQLEMLYSTIYLNIIRKYSQAPVVLRAHNIEHQIWQRVAQNCKNPFKKLYHIYLYRTLRHFELKVLKKVDGIVAITDVDQRNLARLLQKPNIISIPFGINLDTLPDDLPQPDEPSLFHIGTMNWFPNEEGIRWFIEKVWPKVSQKFPELTLHLAGRYMNPWLTVLNKKNVTVDGAVPDVWEYMAKYSIMVVPLFSGSGIRIKIVEAMAAGKAIITTTIGAQGINCEDGKHLIIAHDEKGFLESIIKLHNNKALRDSLGKNAKELIAKEHDNDKLMGRLSEFYDELVQKKPS